MTDQDTIRISAVPVLATLEDLARDNNVLGGYGSLEGGDYCNHLLKVPEDFPVDLIVAAEKAVDLICGLNGDKLRQHFDINLVEEGYRLLKEKKVLVFYYPTEKR